MNSLVRALVVVALIPTQVLAWECPSLIALLSRPVTTKRIAGPEGKRARALVEQARKLHDAGDHDGAVAKAEEAARILGVPIEKP